MERWSFEFKKKLITLTVRIPRQVRLIFYYDNWLFILLNFEYWYDLIIQIFKTFVALCFENRTFKLYKLISNFTYLSWYVSTDRRWTCWSLRLTVGLSERESSSSKAMATKTVTTIATVTTTVTSLTEVIPVSSDS